MKKELTAIYVRVSSEGQVDNYSIPGQLTSAYRLCNQKNLLNIVEYIEDGKTGTSIKKRPQMIRLIKDIKNGLIKNLIIDDLDRMARNTKDSENLRELFEKYNVNVFGVSYTPDFETAVGRYQYRIFSATHQFTSEVIGEKSIKGYLGALEIGEYPFSTPPLGYKKNINKKDIADKNERQKVKVILIPIEEDLKIIKLIFSLYIYESLSIAKISEYLKEEKNINFSQTKISRILCNEKYTGGFHYQGRYFEGIGLLKLITKKEFNIVSAKLKELAKIRKHNYLFDRKLICSKCNEYLELESTKKKNKVYLYYCCNNIFCSCNGLRINQDKVLFIHSHKILQLYNKHNITFYDKKNSEVPDKINKLNHISEQKLKETISLHFPETRLNLIEVNQ